MKNWTKENCLLQQACLWSIKPKVLSKEKTVSNRQKKTPKLGGFEPRAEGWVELTLPRCELLSITLSLYILCPTFQKFFPCREDGKIISAAKTKRGLKSKMMERFSDGPHTRNFSFQFGFHVGLVEWRVSSNGVMISGLI